MWNLRPTVNFREWLRFGIIGWLAMLCVNRLPAQEPSEVPVAASVSEELAERQKNLADQFAKLEELFLRLAELETGSNPTRAGLLQQAARLSKEQATSQRLAAAAQLLTQKQFARAIQEQQAARETLAKLLELLQSENRRERIREERDRIQALLKDIRRIERLQKSLRGRTENGADLMQALLDQQKIESQTGELEQKLSEELLKDSPEMSMDPSQKNADRSSQESQTKESPSKQPSPNDPAKTPSDQNPQDANRPELQTPSPSGDPKSSDDSQGTPTERPPNPETTPPQNPQNPNQGPKTESPQNPSPSPQDQPSGQQNSSDSNSDGEEGAEESQMERTPEQETQRRVQSAQKRMREAQKQMEQAQREGAVEKQRAAENELAKAIEDLERILRQLREEEVERSLADLEGRFRKMLEIQVSVFEESQKLIELTGDARDRQFEVGTNRLAAEERKILLEGQRAMLLLQEEGSSEAFPQILEQILLDVDAVAGLLNRQNLSAATIDIERDIITALEEMLEALNRTRKEREQKARRSPQQSGGQPAGEDPLVDALSELKLVKTLQQRINQRTATVAKRIDDPNQEIGQATTEELKTQLRDLADRQQKIKEVTRNLLLKAQER